MQKLRNKVKIRVAIEYMTSSFQLRPSATWFHDRVLVIGFVLDGFILIVHHN